MRERGQEIKQLKKQLEEKDEVIDTLQGHMELMRKQVILMKTNTGRKQSSSLEITHDTETQTSPTVASGQYSRSSSTSSRSKKRKEACCAIC